APPAMPGMRMLLFERENGVNNGPCSKAFNCSSARCLNSGVKSMRFSSVEPWRSNGGGLVGKGCVGDVCSPGTVERGTGRSSIGQTGSPGFRSNTKGEARFLILVDGLVRRA